MNLDKKPQRTLSAFPLVTYISNYGGQKMISGSISGFPVIPNTDPLLSPIKFTFSIVPWYLVQWINAVVKCARIKRTKPQIANVWAVSQRFPTMTKTKMESMGRLADS